MPLKRPRRLPAHLNRSASPYMQSVARKFHSQARRSRRRRERLRASIRRASKFGQAFLAELKLWLIVLAGISVVSVFATLLFSPAFNVREIRVRRYDARLDIGEIQQVLAPLLSERLFFVTRNHVLSLLQASDPDVTSADIEKDYPNELTVTIHLRPLIAELAIDPPMSAPTSGSGSAMREKAKYVYLSARGSVVTSPVNLSKTPLPVLHVTDWGRAPENRQLLVSSSFIVTVFQARDTLRENFGLPITRITLFVRAREFHIRLNKVEIWFDLASPLPLQFQRFREYLQTFPLDRTGQYVDLRISDRVIYK